jgi:2-dehydropantoate 2-reductase
MAALFPRIGIIGSGAVGTYYGARLALAGADVRFLMRGDLAAVRARGSVVIEDPSGTRELRPVSVFGSAPEMGTVDLVIVGLKTTSASEVQGLVGPLLGPETAIWTLQNGLGPDESLADLFGPARVLGGLVFMGVTRTAPGEVKCFSRGSVSIGEFGGSPGKRLLGLADQLEAAGVEVHVVDSLLGARWNKLVWNIPFNGLAIAEGGVSTDRICADMGLAGEVRELMREVQRAAAGFGFTIPDAFLRKQFYKTPPMGRYLPSSLVDYLAGREVEVEAIWGEPLRRANALGIETPRLARLYSRLRALCSRQRPAASA